MSQSYPSDQGQPQPSYQQPQQPYPPSQQVYGDQRNQMPLPPKPKRGFFRSPLGIGCGVIAALIILVIVIVAIATAASGGGKSPATSSSTTTGNTPAAKPATGNVIAHLYRRVTGR